jgi:hypothetical protein
MGRHIACMVEIRNVHKLLVWSSHRKRVCERVYKNGDII